MATIGTDPEVFLRRKDTGEVMPSCGLVGGTKGKPEPMGDGFGIQEDNVMLEFNTPAADSYDGFAARVHDGMHKCANLLRTRLDDQYEIDGANERVFRTDLLGTEQAQTFGCSPEFNAYDGGAGVVSFNRSALVLPGVGEWRLAGGHVHLGYKPKCSVPPHVVAQFADLWLGLPSIGVDNQPQRRALYGQAGRFRKTGYGIEYRTLSNFWVHSATTINEVAWRGFSLASFLEHATEARMMALYKAVPWADVQDSINTENREKSSDLLHHIVMDLNVPEISNP